MVMGYLACGLVLFGWFVFGLFGLLLAVGLLCSVLFGVVFLLVCGFLGFQAGTIPSSLFTQKL